MTGVQTCALPIYRSGGRHPFDGDDHDTDTATVNGEILFETEKGTRPLVPAIRRRDGENSVTYVLATKTKNLK